MKIPGAIKYFGKALLSIPGWRTNRKIVVIQSDDWGSIRMPSREVYQYCLKKGYHVDKSPYTKYDCLESEDDLEKLFNVLNSHKDKLGNTPKITANVLVANPDFDKIKSFGFSEYFLETVNNTFSSYPAHAKSFDLWKKGNEAGFFFLQAHGREHLNVSRFMNDLRSRNQDALFALETKMPGIFPKESLKGGNYYVVANEYKDQSDKKAKCGIMNDGLIRFQNLFNYQSKSFIPSNYVWDDDFEQIMHYNGVSFIQGVSFQFIPKGDYKGTRKKYHFLGQRNSLGQHYLIRNAFFEPSLNQKTDWIDRCLSEISHAFSLKKPAIISSHRINFVGSIDPENRDKNLKVFNKLLKEILKRWPDIEFMNTVELGKLIQTKKPNENCYT